MGKFTKTIKLSLREPTNRKKERIEEATEQSLKVANEASKRFPSINQKYIRCPKSKGTPLHGIVQDLRNNGITLNSACASQAVEKARESFLSMRENKNYNEIPKFRREFISLHNRDNIGEFFEKDGTFYVILKLFPYEEIVLPFRRGDYQNYFLKRIVNDEIDYGSGEIKKYKGDYYLNLTVKKEKGDTDYEPETFIGVDLGLNMIAWAVAFDSNDNFLGETHFDGGEAGWYRDRYFKKRNRLQKEGNLKMKKKIGNLEQRWMENKNHEVSRRIIEFAKKFDNPIIILEDIDMRELRKRVEDPKIHRWTAGKLRNFIEYKAEEEGIKTKEVNPKNTSRKCSECGHTEKDNRNGINFKCMECGYEAHADFNASVNILKKS